MEPLAGVGPEPDHEGLPRSRPARRGGLALSGSLDVLSGRRLDGRARGVGGISPGTCSKKRACATARARPAHGPRRPPLLDELETGRLPEVGARRDEEPPETPRLRRPALPGSAPEDARVPPGLPRGGSARLGTRAGSVAIHAAGTTACATIRGLRGRHLTTCNTDSRSRAWTRAGSSWRTPARSTGNAFPTVRPRSPPPTRRAGPTSLRRVTRAGKSAGTPSRPR